MRFSLVLVLVALGVPNLFAGDCQTVVTPAITQGYAQPAFTQAITGYAQPQAIVVPQVQMYYQPQVIQRVIAQPVYQPQIIQRQFVAPVYAQRQVVQYQNFAQPVIVRQNVVVARQQRQFGGVVGAAQSLVGGVGGAVRSLLIGN